LEGGFLKLLLYGKHKKIMKAYIGVDAIQGLISKLKSIDNAIGSYEYHSFLEDGSTCFVKLSNGTIRIYLEELSHDDFLPKERIKDILARFIEKH
jgi:hypothetical protein